MSGDIKQKLSDVILDINVAKLAVKYFGKSPSWLYHKFDGIAGNGGAGGFTDGELELLRGALRDLADRIRAAADRI